MKKEDEEILLITEMKRALDLLDKGPEEKEKEDESKGWISRRPIAAELKAKLHEIRRDSTRYEKTFLQ